MVSRIFFKLFVISSVTGSLFFFNACNSALEAGSAAGIQGMDAASLSIDQYPVEEISQAESDGMVYMREEEKLARDVYKTLYTHWNIRVFNNIPRSEQQHMDAIKLLLDRYQLEDPVGNDSLGVFKNETLQELYNTLTTQGSVSLVEALKVGALIEEIDILDLQRELDDDVDNQDITFVYENLMKGSRNHLRAFVRNLSRQGVEYVPQKLSEEQYLEIINSDWERGRR
ncbi:MAG TPA: DUF2202 domain-containing protein [Caldithrix abyssi]|uniref:DUF2202 domain-containing protein n=1 Tax=Caldithrix abyssi TaxID=187145 RepID=A0A7V4WW08_CALAY|nr:DUF2202 domain-containing protein [Caldithrix abyssi]